ncbi:MAG: hypothetical protein DME26_17490 [Verrucomicrobia bacterium]|nr:MAG: hypothetical protein DME26_17490 [Verrucomicrobiota bacterium]
MKRSTLTLAFRQPRTLSSPLEQVVKSRCPYNSCFVPRPSLWPLLLLFVAALASPAYAATGDMDPGFNPAVNGIVYSTAMQPDGKIIIGGEFTTVGGLTRNRVARLNEDGSLDTGFNPDVGGTGYFAAVGGTARTNLARLNADGTLDRTFTANANWFVFSTAVQTDGKILIAGQFTTLAGAARANLARLNADGSLDFGFTPNVGFQVYSVAVQPDGKIVIGGTFFFIGGTPRNRIARLNTDGSLDPGFNPDADGWISGIAMQADGKIIIGGFFRAVGGLAHTNIARLNVDGTVDSRFNPHANDAVLSIALQTDGEIIIGGTFTSLGGTPRSRLARLNADGTTDTAFDLGIDSVVYSTALQANGKVVIGGKLVTVDDPDDPTPPRFIARLENDAATQNLIVTNASEVEWLRGGASPEAQDVSFELSTDAGKTWTVLGAGIRSAGGYTLTGLSLPANGQVRARARVIGGYYNGSAGFVELVSGFSGLDTVPHVVTPIANVAVNEDAANTVIDLHPVFQDAETAEADLVYSIQTNSNPTLVSATIDNTTDTLTLDYQANQFGTAAITVRATDTAGLYVDDTFVVTVNQVHDGDPGDLDLSFNPNVDGTVHSTALQPDGKIIIGGTFTFVGGVARNNLARLNADGSLDPGFNSKASFNVTSMAVQADGKIVIGGGFTSVDGTTRNRVARLNPDGSLDTGFNPDANDFVYNTVVQVDGKIVIGGAFTTGHQLPSRLQHDSTGRWEDDHWGLFHQCERLDAREPRAA